VGSGDDFRDGEAAGAQLTQLLRTHEIATFLSGPNPNWQSGELETMSKT
jgi:hypothetical protein